MKKLTKNVFAKLFATFLGVATILTPLATVISCTQTKNSVEQKTKHSIPWTELIPAKPTKPKEKETPVKDENNNKISYPIQVTENNNTKEVGTIELVKVKKEGEETETIKLKINANIPSNETQKIINILKNGEYKEKKDGKLYKYENMEFTDSSNLNIRFKEEINIINLDLLAQKMPKPIKIDDEKTVELDNTANITKITAPQLNLSNITKTIEKDATNLTESEFISYKIQNAPTDKKIKSDELTINATGNETFKKENLEKLAKVLTKTSIKGTQNIELNTDAKLTSVSGKISLADITKGVTTGNVNIAGYIADKIQTQQGTISSSGLNITTTDAETFTKADLETVAKKLTKTNIKGASQTIALDTDAKLTSVSGNIKLADITKGAATDKVNVAGFIADKIQTQQGTISSSGLNITTTDAETFTKANLETVAKKLTKTEVVNTTLNGTQNISFDKDVNIKSISGEVSLKDVLEAKDEATTGLTNYVLNSLKNDTNIGFDSSNLKINTFHKTLKPGHTGTSISLLNTDDVNYTLTPVTLSFLKDMEQTALNKTSFNYKDGNKTIGVSFGNVSLDITDFSNEIESNNKLQEILNFPEDAIKDTKIQLTGEREHKTHQNGYWDITPYPRVDELLKIVKNESLRKNIEVSSVQLRGNVKELLPYLTDDSDKKIKEINNGIKFTSYQDSSCPAEFVTYYNAKTEGEVLPIEQLKAFRSHTQENKPLRIDNAIITLDSTTISPKKLTEIDLKGSLLRNVVFKGGNLSKLNLAHIDTGSSEYIKFENTTLPYNMYNASIGKLILNNVTLPAKEMVEDAKNTPIGVRNIGAVFPKINRSLEIYGYIKNDLSKFLTSEELEELKDDSKLEIMPDTYKGPQDIYEKLKTYIYIGESVKKEFGNFTISSLNKKPQSPVLLALLQGKADHTRG